MIYIAVCTGFFSHWIDDIFQGKLGWHSLNSHYRKGQVSFGWWNNLSHFSLSQIGSGRPEAGLLVDSSPGSLRHWGIERKREREGEKERERGHWEGERESQRERDFSYFPWGTGTGRDTERERRERQTDRQRGGETPEQTSQWMGYGHKKAEKPECTLFQDTRQTRGWVQSFGWSGPLRNDSGASYQGKI